MKPMVSLAKKLTDISQGLPEKTLDLESGFLENPRKNTLVLTVSHLFMYYQSSITDYCLIC